MVEMVVVTSLLTPSPATPTLSDTPERVPQAPPQHCSLPLSQVLIHKPRENMALHPPSLLNSHFVPVSHTTPIAMKPPFLQDLPVFWDFLWNLYPWKGQTFFPRTWTVPTTMPSGASTGRSQRCPRACQLSPGDCLWLCYELLHNSGLRY